MNRKPSRTIAGYIILLLVLLLIAILLNDTLQAIAAALQCTVDELLQGGAEHEAGRAVS